MKDGAWTAYTSMQMSDRHRNMRALASTTFSHVNVYVGSNVCIVYFCGCVNKQVYIMYSTHAITALTKQSVTGTL